MGYPDAWVGNIKETLDYLQEELPKTLVNLVQIFDIAILKGAANNPYGPVCKSFYSTLCPCGPYGSIAMNNSTILNHTSEVARQYQAGLVELINSGQYNTGNDFTVVLQPFFTESSLPIGPSGYADLSTLAVDCFHFSPSGGRVTAVNLWNNMFQDVGEKTEAYDHDPAILCPTDKEPYIRTSLAVQVVASLVTYSVAVGLGMLVALYCVIMAKANEVGLFSFFWLFFFCTCRVFRECRLVWCHKMIQITDKKNA